TPAEAMDRFIESFSPALPPGFTGLTTWRIFEGGHFYPVQTGSCARVNANLSRLRKCKRKMVTRWPLMLPDGPNEREYPGLVADFPLLSGQCAQQGAQYGPVAGQSKRVLHQASCIVRGCLALRM
ncbi:hypothetical protein, partial [Acetobacter sp. DsW_063]|uniref:hypothetical protein n=1 Tax=Acetobacter sp. DsW_063 TaxID=1514894 RepID=UPI001E64313A